MYLPALLGFASIAVLAVFVLFPRNNIDDIKPLRRITGNDRILVFAPHCDDEVLGAGGTILKAINTGAQVSVVLITNGDNNFFSTVLELETVYPDAAKYIEAGEERQKESIDALVSLGMNEKDILFLGYPDRGVKSLFDKNWTNNNPYKSRSTDETRSVYRLSYEKNALYSGENLLKNITQIITDFKPTIVIAPHEYDKHPDHKYSYKFILMALTNIYSKTQEKPMLLTYLVHYHEYSKPEKLKKQRYLLPPPYKSLGDNWRRVDLDISEQNRKRDAVMRYKSQLKVPELGELMRSFVRKNELFHEVSY